MILVGGLVEVLIINVEVDVHFLRWEYPYPAVVKECEQGAHRHTAVGHPLFYLHPRQAVDEVEELSRSRIERCADGIAFREEGSDDILKQQFALGTTPSSSGFQLGMPVVQFLAGSGNEAIDVGIGRLIERVFADDAAVYLSFPKSANIGNFW